MCTKQVARMQIWIKMQGWRLLTRPTNIYLIIIIINIDDNNYINESNNNDNTNNDDNNNDGDATIRQNEANSEDGSTHEKLK